MKDFNETLSHDDCYMIYNALVVERNRKVILINHETEDVNLLRMYRGQVTKLEVLISIFQEYIK